MDILLHFNWTYVSVVYSEGYYGENAADQLQLAAARHGICVGLTLALAQHSGVSHAVEQVITKLIEIDAATFIIVSPAASLGDELCTGKLTEIDAQVVILFTHLEETRTLFSAVQQQQLVGR